MTATATEPVFVHRLGKHHFAHLRAVAEGLPVTESALRYLAIYHGNQAVTAHRETVDAVRAVARRHRETSWRLVGLAIPVSEQTSQPTLAEFAETTPWASDFSEAELLEAYQERYPTGRKPARRLRLRENLLATLSRIEKLVVVPPQATDALAGWYDQDTADRLAAIGLGTLADLNARIASDPQWHAAAKAIGSVKAERIEHHLGALIPLLPKRYGEPAPPATHLPGAVMTRPPLLPGAPAFAVPAVLGTSTAVEERPVALTAAGGVRQPRPRPLAFPDPLTRCFLETPSYRAYSVPPDSFLDATDDVGAIYEWVKVVVGSTETAKTYLREARRFLLWLYFERGLDCLADIKVIDCNAYIDFLGQIPSDYISASTSRAKPGEAAWRPFRGQLDASSRQQSIVIVAAMYTWLAAAAYLPRNPWAIINKNVVTKRATKRATSKAVGEDLFKVLLDFIESRPPSMDRARIRFIFLFLESVGLRSSELIAAKVKDLSYRENRWFLAVVGKGSKARDVSIAKQGMDALQEYLAYRTLPRAEDADGETPLVASNRDSMRPIAYPTLYAHVKSWFKASLDSPGVNARQAQLLAGASTHWLRHTFGNHSMARGVPSDVIQGQMGHASIKTTHDTYGTAPEERLADEIAKAFGGAAASPRD
ncbi:MAG: tyrosine-type recombinase/integrase [Polaromonas sp.]|uniref:tyrosine-type recombinase/integrase n=1 Tax=Polaromonas sp. TaxID=1869339 RepID=UPI0024881CD0|nr:tyrosine-type recombinase/integrase [Polaromonas sp.]MDI1236388.1 tyrosine-type recombinase/integrase [Polaromonas sp.]